MNTTTDSPGATGDLQTALRHAAILLRSDPAAAAEQARQILAVCPGEPHAGILLATAERRAGHPELAVDAARAVVDVHPLFAAALEELGLSLLAAGQWIEAEQALARAVDADPGLADAWIALGDIRGLRDGQTVRESSRPQAGGVRSAGSMELIGAAEALRSDNFKAAEALCRTVIRREPRNVAAMRLLADIGIRLGRFDDAESLLTYCLELAPEYHAARRSYAQLLFRRMQYRDARREIEIVLAAEPNRPAHLILKASILAQTGETDEAIRIYDSILGQFPGQSRVHLNKGHALKTIGRQAEAISAYRTAIDLEPTLGEAYWSLSNLKTFRFDDTDIGSMRLQLDGRAKSDEDCFHLSFALGKALEDKGQFRESFRRYAEGNNVRRRTVSWSADEHHAALEQVTRFFTQPFLESRLGSGNPSSAPIFVVGLPRAGSTLLEQILASHSLVEGTMELPDIMSIARRLNGRRAPDGTAGYPGILAELTANDLEALGNEYLERTAVHRTGAPRFIDKMPNNFAHIGLIHLMLPNAVIIDARRQPMACCFSVFKQLFASGQNFSYRLEEIGRYYRDYVDLMSHWDRVLPGRVLRVDYEAVVGDTEAEVRRILRHCGLEFESTCLEFHRTERAVRTASSEQVRQPIYTSAVDQWRNYEAYLEPLRAALGPAVQ